jgi:transcriptional regulator with XRE-family HTH domain
MPSKKRRIEHARIVKLFAARLRERRIGSGLTQTELAERASVAPNYVGRLEAAGAAPGIDTLEQLASALGTTPHDLLPLSAPAETLSFLRDRGQALFDEFVKKADREAWQTLVPLLAKLVEGPD